MDNQLVFASWSKMPVRAPAITFVFQTKGQKKEQRRGLFLHLKSAPPKLWQLYLMAVNCSHATTIMYGMLRYMDLHFRQWQFNQCQDWHRGSKIGLEVRRHWTVSTTAGEPSGHLFNNKLVADTEKDKMLLKVLQISNVS